MKTEDQHALREIRHDSKKCDLIKARLVMDHFPELDLAEQKAILQELDTTDDNFSIPVLSYLLVKHPGICDKFPAIPDTIMIRAMQSPDVILNGLTKDVPEKIYYVPLAAKINLQQAVPNLAKLLLQFKEKKHLLTTLACLGTLGNPEAINEVTECLYMDDFELAASAVVALSQIATTTAIQRLAEFLGHNSKVDPLILDVFAEIQDDFSLRKLNEAMQSRSSSLRNHARGWLTAIGAKSVPLLLSNLSGFDIDLQILSLNVLQEIGDKSAALSVRKLINSQPKNSNVRFAAYETLADLSDRKGDYVLAGGLDDQNNNVRLAAAKAIDRNLDPVLLAGVRNMVQETGGETESVIRAIIDAQAGNLFMGLIGHLLFKEIACSYLGKSVHKDVRDFFVKRLLKEGSAELVNEILRLAQQQKKSVLGRICAVDDSKMILNIYRSIITELGFESILFSKPKEAIAWLEKEKPDFLCTDLNMPEITGIELIKKVRKQYHKDELPIILVTTQNEIQDNKAAWEAGVNEIIYKPFDTEMLSSTLKKIKEEDLNE